MTLCVIMQSSLSLEKPLLVSGNARLPLETKAFSVSFGEYNPADLQKQWMRVIKEEMKMRIYRIQKNTA